MESHLKTDHAFKMLHYLAVAMVIGQSTALSVSPSTEYNETLGLFLSPLIEDGDIKKAQRLSYVESSTVPPSHSGYITVDKAKRNHLHFWYFPSQEVKDAPLLIWLNGGPGVSSMYGLFYGSGPIEIVENGSSADNGSYHFRRREVTWVGAFSMLYIDQPVGTGYSFTETRSYPTSQADYTHELASFVDQFYSMFPDLYSRPLYIGGNSYAGRYVPAVAHLIHTRIQRGSSKLPLEGIYIGGPYFDPETMLPSFFDLPYMLGAISHHEMVTFKAAVNKLYSGYLNNDIPARVSDFIGHVLPRQVSSKLSYNNFDDPWPYYQSLRRMSSIQKVMESKEVRTLLHTGNEGQHQTRNALMLDYLLKDFFQGTKKELGVLMDNYKVLLISGNYDIIVSVAMVEAALMSTPWSMQGVYNTSRRLAWRDGDLNSTRGPRELFGFYTYVGNLCRVILSGAGHNTVGDEPEVSLGLMKDFVHRGCVPDHQSNWDGPLTPVVDSSGRGCDLGYFVVTVSCTIHFIKSRREWT